MQLQIACIGGWCRVDKRPGVGGWEVVSSGPKQGGGR